MSGTSEDKKISTFKEILSEIGPGLSVIVINSDDILVYNERLLSRNLTSDLPVIIDISDSLAGPRVLREPAILAQVLEMRSRVARQISDLCCSIQTDPTGNVSNLFGLLLNYPVVYFYSDVQSCENCLSFVDLVSSKLYLESDSGQARLIASFTFPESLTASCQQSVEAWLKSYRDGFNHLQFRLESEIVNLDVVVL